MQIEPFILLLLILLPPLMYGFLWVWQSKKSESDQPWQVVAQWLQELRGSLDHNSDIMQNHLYQSSQMLSNRLDHSYELLHSLNQDMAKVKEMGEQMRDLGHLFRSPKLRGGVGEQLLKDLLYDVLPVSQIKWQYRFKNGTIVDALVLTAKGAIAVDAKFPMENFIKWQKHNDERYKKQFFQDVKKHVENIAQKYILPAEGTVDFALLYLPTEMLFMEIQNSESLLQFARSRKILYVSPHTLYYLLRIILMGLESAQIHEKAQDLIRGIFSLRQQATQVQSTLQTTFHHLNHAQNALSRGLNDLQQFITRMNDLDQLINVKPDQDQSKGSSTETS
ncbi:DNA recombination protein RmuC [candidate division KSB1 bacterium]|nr:DNA recombination protein RmuC [candidate division KSB1 bacterium]